MEWCADRGIELRDIQPGKPDQNAFIERFNRTYRTEVLNADVFESFEQVREISTEWLQRRAAARCVSRTADGDISCPTSSRQFFPGSVALTGELT